MRARQMTAAAARIARDAGSGSVCRGADRAAQLVEQAGDVLADRRQFGELIGEARYAVFEFASWPRRISSRARRDRLPRRLRCAGSSPRGHREDPATRRRASRRRCRRIRAAAAAIAVRRVWSSSRRRRPRGLRYRRIELPSSRRTATVPRRGHRWPRHLTSSTPAPFDAVPFAVVPFAPAPLCEIASVSSARSSAEKRPATSLRRLPSVENCRLRCKMPSSSFFLSSASFCTRSASGPSGVRSSASMFGGQRVAVVARAAARGW